MTKQNFYKFLVAVSVVTSVVAYGQYTNWRFFSRACSRPIFYSLGSFDNRFGISQDEFMKDVDQAVQVWENAIDKNLFEYAPSGKLKINLVYDYRQEATDKLKSLGFTIDDSESSYNSLKTEYDSLVSQYNSLKQTIDVQIATYNPESKAYEQSVNYWNSRGGAPKNVAEQLNRQREDLNALASQINQEQAQLNNLVSQINALANTLNRQALELNLNVSTYNTVGSSRGQEFEEGLYKSDFSSQSIDIYEFSNENMLVRVLAHELGHALGLDHVDDQNAIMFKLNQSKNAKPTVADLAELKRLCRIK